MNPYTSRSNASAISEKVASGQYLKADALHELASRPVAPIQVKRPNGQILRFLCKTCLRFFHFVQGNCGIGFSFVAHSILYQTFVYSKYLFLPQCSSDIYICPKKNGTSIPFTMCNTWLVRYRWWRYRTSTCQSMLFWSFSNKTSFPLM